MLAKELHYIGEIINSENENENNQEQIEEKTEEQTETKQEESSNKTETKNETEENNEEIIYGYDGDGSINIDKWLDEDTETSDSAIGENLSTEIETNDISLLVRSLPLAEQAKFTTSLLNGEYKTFCK